MDGFVNLLKPPGMTSQNAVSDVGRIFGIRHAGHLGTLDPGAAGVLPVALGRATKLFDLLSGKEKCYLFEILFGVSTDTLDLFGKVTGTSSASVREEEVRDAIPQLAGTYLQRAPAFSALKIGGKRMYDLARNGVSVPERRRSVTVSELQLVRQTGANRFLISCRCTRGTYIRTLCEEIGAAAGVPAVMSFLLRTASGPFRLEESVTLEELRALAGENRLEEAVSGIPDVLSFLQRVDLPKERKRPVLNGLSSKTAEAEDGPALVYSGGAFLGLGEVRSGEVRLKVHLYGE